MKKILACMMIYTLTYLVFSGDVLSQTLSGEEIIQRVDDNNFYEKIEYNGKMTIKKGDRVRAKNMHLYAEGSDKAFIEFTNPEDRGTRYLKLKDELWMNFPDAEESVKISGHMLRESMMGSDFSYEDMIENKELIKQYSISVLETETINDRDCYVLELNAKERDVTYAKRKVWVDKERFVVLRSQLFALSGRLLKETNLEDVKKFGNRYFPTKLSMENKLTRDSSTTFEMTDVNFNPKLPSGVFTRRYLER